MYPVVVLQYEKEYTTNWPARVVARVAVARWGIRAINLRDIMRDVDARVTRIVKL